MTAEQFEDWLTLLKHKQLIKVDHEAADALGIHRNTISRHKKSGTDRTTDLACAAIVAGLKPWPHTTD